MKEENEVGTTGVLVDLLNENLTQDEWNAICIVHKLTNRLNIGVQFNYNKSIDIISSNCSQIIDESVFLNKQI